jgi:hypothetical protein
MARCEGQPIPAWMRSTAPHPALLKYFINNVQVLLKSSEYLSIGSELEVIDSTQHSLFWKANSSLTIQITDISWNAKFMYCP